MSRVARASLFALVLVQGLTSGCAVLRSVVGGTHKAASAKSAKDVAACEKMCEVAGNAEENKAAVDRCKKDCRD
jgi:hypothetical protein